MSSSCVSLKAKYEELLALARAFETDYLAVRDSGDMTEAKQLKKELALKRNTLKEKLLSFRWERYDRRSFRAVEYKKWYAVKETLKGHTGSVRPLQVLPDGRIVSGSDDHTIKIWDGKKVD